MFRLAGNVRRCPPHPCSEDFRRGEKIPARLFVAARPARSFTLMVRRPAQRSEAGRLEPRGPGISDSRYARDLGCWMIVIAGLDPAIPLRDAVPFLSG